MTLLVAFAVIAVIAVIFGLMAVNWTPGRYKVGYARGAELGARTAFETGFARFSADAFDINGPDPVNIPLNEITGIDMFAVGGLRRAFRIHWRDQAVVLAVVRFVVGKQFAQGDYFGARRLAAEFRRRIPQITA